MTGRWTRGALSLGAIALIAAALAGTAAARVDARGGAVASKTVNVGFIYPKTGGLSQFGSEEYDGFLAGLAYTKGQCGGYTINPTFVDDATDAATAIAAFKNLVGQGTKIIAGTGSSGIALQLGPLAAQNNVLYISGPAASDAITGLNRNTFRAGRQTLQDVLDAANIFPPKSTGKKVVVFAEDTAFGAGNAAAVQAIFGSELYDAFGPLVPGVTLVSHYVWQAPHNAVNTWLIKYLAKQHKVPNIFTPDGFVSAQMICHALAKGGPDTSKQISALEGWQFLAPKGKQYIRPTDHAMLQPMFQVQLVPASNGHFAVKVLKTISPGNVQPPVTPFK